MIRFPYGGGQEAPGPIQVRGREFVRAVLGQNLHDVYSNEQIKLAIDRNSVENLNKQLLSTDITEIFIPARVAAHY